VTIGPRRPVAAAAALMLDRKVNRLQVVDDGKLVGIVTRADLVRAFARPDDEIRSEIEEDVLRRAVWPEPGVVGVGVDRGIVRLEGVLERRMDVEVAERLVARVLGVVSVDSRLRWRDDDRQVS
jgi:CBS domain-containing protein